MRVRVAHYVLSAHGGVETDHAGAPKGLNRPRKYSDKKGTRGRRAAADEGRRGLPPPRAARNAARPVAPGGVR